MIHTTPIKKNTIHSDLEASFIFHWRSVSGGLPEPISQYKFSVIRKFALDFAWPEYRVGIELDGGGFGNLVVCHNCGAVVHARNADVKPGKELRVGAPSHYSAAGKARDAEKSNALVVAGWKPLRYTSERFKSQPRQVIEEIVQLIRSISSALAPSPLTPREKQVIAMVCDGQTVLQIAAACGISPRTVIEHLSNIREKYHSATTNEAIAKITSTKAIISAAYWPKNIDQLE